MKGRKSIAWRKFRAAAYWRTADQLSGFLPSYGLSLRLNAWANASIELEWFAGRRAGVLIIGCRFVR